MKSSVRLKEYCLRNISAVIIELKYMPMIFFFVFIMYCHLSHKPSSHFAYANWIIIFRHPQCKFYYDYDSKLFQVSFKIYSRNVIMHALTDCAYVNLLVHVVLWQSHFTSTSSWIARFNAMCHWASWKPYPGPAAGFLLPDTWRWLYTLTWRGFKLGLKLAIWWVCLQKAWLMLQKTCLFPFSYPRETSNEMQCEIQHRIALIYLVCLATTISTGVVYEILHSRASVEFDHFLCCCVPLPLHGHFCMLGLEAFPTQSLGVSFFWCWDYTGELSLQLLLIYH